MKKEEILQKELEIWKAKYKKVLKAYIDLLDYHNYLVKINGLEE